MLKKITKRGTVSACLTLAVVWSVLMCPGTSEAHSRRFTYSYEPDVEAAGALEYEQWITARLGRTAKAGYEDYQKWAIRHELEYGITERLTGALYFNWNLLRGKEAGSGLSLDDEEFDSVSVELKYALVPRENNPVGVTLYGEVGSNFDNETEFEQKLILGQTHGKWTWAVNLIHEMVWEEGELEAGEAAITAGLAYDLSPNWSVGVETRWHNEFPGYDEWEYSVLHAGPAVRYQKGNFWGTLTVMPQLWGQRIDDSDKDGVSNLELSSKERWEVRLIFGIIF